MELSDEAVAAPVNRLNVARIPGVVAKGLTKLGNPNLEHGFGHRSLWPDLVEQLFFRRQPPPIPHQVAQDVERLRFELDLLLTAPYTLVRLVQTKRAKGCLRSTVGMDDPLPERYPRRLATALHADLRFGFKAESLWCEGRPS